MYVRANVCARLSLHKKLFNSTFFFRVYRKKNFLLIFAYLVFSQRERVGEWERLRWIYCLSCHYWRNFFPLRSTSLPSRFLARTWHETLSTREANIELLELCWVSWNPLTLYLKRLFCVFKLFFARFVTTKANERRIIWIFHIKFYKLRKVVCLLGEIHSPLFLNFVSSSKKESFERIFSRFHAQRNTWE